MRPRGPYTRARARYTHYCQQLRFLLRKGKAMSHINFTYGDLADMLERYPLKARSTTSTNNATPKYIPTIISGVKTAFRRITGEQATDETLGDLLWLDIGAVAWL